MASSWPPPRPCALLSRQHIHKVLWIFPYQEFLWTRMVPLQIASPVRKEGKMKIQIWLSVTFVNSTKHIKDDVLWPSKSTEWIIFLKRMKIFLKKSVVKKGDNSMYLSSHKDRFFHRCVYLGQRLTATTFGELVYSVYHESYAVVLVVLLEHSCSSSRT